MQGLKRNDGSDTFMEGLRLTTRQAGTSLQATQPDLISGPASASSEAQKCMPGERMFPSVPSPRDQLHILAATVERRIFAAIFKFPRGIQTQPGAGRRAHRRHVACFCCLGRTVAISGLPARIPQHPRSRPADIWQMGHGVTRQTNFGLPPSYIAHPAMSCTCISLR